MRLISHVGVLVGVLSSVGGALAGCGGESTRSGGNTGTSGGDTGASGGSGGSGSGETSATGSGAVGGTISTGGGAIGPGGTGGSAAGTGGAGKGGGAGSIAAGGSAGKGSGGSGVGGTVPSDPCSLPPDSGPCDAAFQRFYFDAEHGVCGPFTYGGCEGNSNNFETLDACDAECGGPIGETMRCEIPMDCTVVPSVCCACEKVGPHELIAIRRDSSDDFLQSTCGAIGCECEAAVPPWAGATCIQGRCVAVDIRETEYTECTVDTDCVLRRGLDCCEDCSLGGGEMVGVRKDRDVGELTCGALVDCEACSSENEPRATSAICDSGRCTVSILLF
jgi:hypothetical protein